MGATLTVVLWNFKCYNWAITAMGMLTFFIVMSLTKSGIEESSYDDHNSHHPHENQQGNTTIIINNNPRPSFFDRLCDYLWLDSLLGSNSRRRQQEQYTSNVYGSSTQQGGYETDEGKEKKKKDKEATAALVLVVTMLLLLIFIALGTVFYYSDDASIWDYITRIFLIVSGIGYVVACYNGMVKDPNPAFVIAWTCATALSVFLGGKSKSGGRITLALTISSLLVIILTVVLFSPLKNMIPGVKDLNLV